MQEIRPCAPKKHSELALEWDQLVEERHRQIAAGDDVSFEHILVPTIFQLLEGADISLVLDIGTGTGDFTARLAGVAERIISFEPSPKSVELARDNCRGASNVYFIQSPLEEAAIGYHEKLGTAAVACMTVMTTPDIEGFAKALASLLENEAKFIAILSHPWFWPRYWGYEKEEWFSYSEEVFIEAPFVISRCSTELRTTHVHRPLEMYVSVFSLAGFRLEALVEPMPSPEIEALYPQPWRYPRFLGLRWVKVV
jgi:SAM-dependent methyltransferase